MKNSVGEIEVEYEQALMVLRRIVQSHPGLVVDEEYEVSGADLIRDLSDWINAYPELAACLRDVAKV